MDKTQQPGINFDRVDLFDCRICKITLKNEWNYNLKLVHKRRVISEDKKRLMVLFGFDIMCGIEKPPFEFKSSFLAHYSREESSNMTWEEFNDAMALAHVIPFLREFISNMTTRMPTPVLMLPPINVFVLISEYEKQKLAEASAASPAPAPEAPAE